MTPSTDTLKQEESWEDEFYKKFHYVIYAYLGEHSWCDDLYKGFLEFIRSLIHQTQQAERKRISKLLPKRIIKTMPKLWCSGYNSYRKELKRKLKEDSHELLKKLEDKT